MRQAGKHVLCEKPMAMTESECLEILNVCEAHNVRLMIAYRLHFEEANLKAVELVPPVAKSASRGSSSRFLRSRSATTTSGFAASSAADRSYDLGVYCINAARSLFRDEPIEVLATSATRATTPDLRKSMR